jgi:CheY-like chemotaxis protein
MHVKGASLAGIDTNVVNEILADAIKADYTHAAVAAANELGRRRDLQVLYTSDGQPAPLTNALAHSDRRVRVVALQAIIALDPMSPFPGSSRVPEALAWFAGGLGESRAIVAMPKILMATDLAGMLAAHKLDAEATNRGRDAIQWAQEWADLEMIFVDMDVAEPDIRQVLFEMRTNPESARIPIALLAADGRLDAAQRLASEHERVIAVPRLHSPEILARTVEQLNELGVTSGIASSSERTSQAVQAMSWLSKLLASQSAGSRSFYDLHRAASAADAALYRPETAKLAIEVLARVGTPESQRTLVDFASERTLPGQHRAQAAQAFRASVDHHGLLLTTDEILTQYDRYNASATADAETQQILGELLDAIESRRTAQR